MVIMKKMIYLFLSILIIGFIFGNSLMDAVDSNSESGFLTAFAQHVLNWLGFHVPIAELHHIIRKLRILRNLHWNRFLSSKLYRLSG